MRWLSLLILVVAVAGCPRSASDEAMQNAFGADAGAGNAPLAPCDRDDQCALEGATCCACGSFAVAANDPALKQCGTINCPSQNCPNVRAACREGACQLACGLVACDASCPTGFIADASGCLTCGCFAPGPGTCARDTDCIEAKADCCGCEHGGSDFAILASDAAGYQTNLGCPNNPQCPNQNVCTPDAAPHCIQGSCALASPRALPANACGRSDLAACVPGQICTLNVDPDADAQGVGVCMPISP